MYVIVRCSEPSSLSKEIRTRINSDDLVFAHASSLSRCGLESALVVGDDVRWNLAKDTQREHKALLKTKEEN